MARLSRFQELLSESHEDPEPQAEVQITEEPRPEEQLAEGIRDLFDTLLAREHVHLLPKAIRNSGIYRKLRPLVSRQKQLIKGFLLTTTCRENQKAAAVGQMKLAVY
jgi:hypothetical protein